MAPAFLFGFGDGDKIGAYPASLNDFVSDALVRETKMTLGLFEGGIDDGIFYNDRRHVPYLTSYITTQRCAKYSLITCYYFVHSSSISAKSLGWRDVLRLQAGAPVKNTGKAGCAAFSYSDNNVASFWSASEIVSVGKVHINSACRACQSRLLTWSDNIAPATGNPGGRRTSKG